MNRFAIHGPLTVEGGKMSASRRNIHVPLKDAIGSVPTQHQPKSKKGWKKKKHACPWGQWEEVLCPGGRDEPSNTITSRALYLETFEEGCALNFNRSILRFFTFALLIYDR